MFSIGVCMCVTVTVCVCVCVCVCARAFLSLCSIMEKGEEHCGDLIEKHKECMRQLGFKV